jgi:hypothetical protein
MAGYLGATPVPQATQHRESFTATAGQTTFNTAGYTVGFVDVYLNGVHLTPADVTATNGSDVVLGACLVNDIVDVISHSAFELNAQTFTGTTTMDVVTATGVVTANGGAVFNEGSADVDFRVESNGNANMLFVDGGNDAVVISDTTSRTVNGAGHKLQINHTDYSCLSVVAYKAAEDGAILSLGHSRSGTIGTNTVLQNGDFLGGITFVGADGTDLNTQGARIDVNVDGTPGANDLPTRMSFRTTADGAASTTERMRIDSSGNVMVGATSQVSPDTARILSVKTGNRANIVAVQSDSGGYNYTSRAAANSGVYYHFHFAEGTTTRGSITSNGSATAYNTSSDYRLKTDAKPMTGASARVLALNPVNFKWIADDTRVDGFLAHEAQAVVPEAVTGTKDAMRDEEYEVTPAVLDDDGNETKKAVMGTRSVPDMQGIDQSKMVPLLVAALQEALARITALENA